MRPFKICTYASQGKVSFLHLTALREGDYIHYSRYLSHGQDSAHASV